MNDKEAAKYLQEAAVGISVAIDQLATLRLAIVEESILIEKVLALQKLAVVKAGFAPQEIDLMLAAMTEDARRSILARLRRDPESASGSEGESPNQGPN